jgi:hypothetical protein
MDPITTGLAASVVAALTHHFGTLGKEAAKEGAKKLGAHAAEEALQLYQRVREKLTGTPAQSSLEVLKKTPGDPVAQEQVRNAVARALEHDDGFRGDVQTLIAMQSEVSQHAEQSGDGNVNAQISGSNNQVNIRR